MTLFKNPCCYPCGSCGDIMGYCWQFTIGGVQGPSSGPPYCNDNNRYSSCPDYNGTWTLIFCGTGENECFYYVCGPAVCCFNEFGPPFNSPGCGGRGWIFTLVGGVSGWQLNNDCVDAHYTMKGGLSLVSPNTFTLQGTPTNCLGWPRTVQLTPVPPKYDSSGNVIPCQTCCACPNPWPAYKFTLPDPPGGCDSANNPQPQPNPACTCGVIFGQTYEMQLLSLDSDAPWVCVYGVTVGEWSFNLIIQNIGPDSRTVSLTGSLSSDCIYPGIVSAGQLLRWEQTYTDLGLATQPCWGSYTLPMAGFGDGLGCYCEGFGQGPSVTVGAVTG